MARPPFAREFAEIAGFPLPPRRINTPGLKLCRADALFDQIARVCFDRPTTGLALERRLSSWLSRAARRPNPWARREEAWALAGYVYYCRKRYAAAERAFSKAVALAPENLDNWFDLAMALRHQGEPLGADILLDHDLFVRHFVALRPAVLSRSALRRLKRMIAQKGQDYRSVCGRWIAPHGP